MWSEEHNLADRKIKKILPRLSACLTCPMHCDEPLAIRRLEIRQLPVQRAISLIHKRATELQVCIVTFPKSGGSAYDRLEIGVLGPGRMSRWIQTRWREDGMCASSGSSRARWPHRLLDRKPSIESMGFLGYGFRMSPTCENKYPAGPSTTHLQRTKATGGYELQFTRMCGVVSWEE
jgi:hypothetical protein